jgi:hypothetical protein
MVQHVNVVTYPIINNHCNKNFCNIIPIGLGVGVLQNYPSLFRGG